jgi:hypothetical protein
MAILPYKLVNRLPESVYIILPSRELFSSYILQLYLEFGTLFSLNPAPG